MTVQIDSIEARADICLLLSVLDKLEIDRIIRFIADSRDVMVAFLEELQLFYLFYVISSNAIKRKLSGQIDKSVDDLSKGKKLNSMIQQKMTVTITL